MWSLDFITICLCVRGSIYMMVMFKHIYVEQA